MAASALDQSSRRLSRTRELSTQIVRPIGSRSTSLKVAGSQAVTATASLPCGTWSARAPPRPLTETAPPWSTLKAHVERSERRLAKVRK